MDPSKKVGTYIQKALSLTNIKGPSAECELYHIKLSILMSCL